MKNTGFPGLDKRKRFRAGFTGFFAGISAWIWWFLLYPELCFPNDTCEVVYETDGKETGALEEEISHLLLQADKEQVIVKSRLLELIRQHKNQ